MSITPGNAELSTCIQLDKYDEMSLVSAGAQRVNDLFLRVVACSSEHDVHTHARVTQCTQCYCYVLKSGLS